MHIFCKNISKKFHKEWIFKNVTFEFHSGNMYAITGSNGSGKSTLLQSIIGYEPLTEGDVSYTDQSELTIPQENFYKYFAVSSPLVELIEEFTIRELYRFHHSLKPIVFSESDFIDKIQLPNAGNKTIANLSSGMRQRVKLGLTLFSDAPVLFLDEPTMNLDKSGKQWYGSQIQSLLPQKLILIASNEPEEYQAAQEILNIENYKK